MPDFTIETYWQCSSMDNHTAKIGGYMQHGLFDERQYPQCSCPAYKFGKRTVNFGGQLFPEPCKHIAEAEKSVCTWNSCYSSVRMEKEGICPACCKEATPVRIAV